MSLDGHFLNPYTNPSRNTQHSLLLLQVIITYSMLHLDALSIQSMQDTFEISTVASSESITTIIICETHHYYASLHLDTGENIGYSFLN